MAVPNNGSHVANATARNQPPSSAASQSCSCKNKSDCLGKGCPCYKEGEICDAGICNCSPGNCLNYAGSLQLIEERRRINDKAGLAYAQKVFDEHWKAYGPDTSASTGKAGEKSTTKTRGKASSKGTKKSPAINTTTNGSQMILPTMNHYPPIVPPMMISPSVPVPMHMNHHPLHPFASPTTSRLPMIPLHLNHNRFGIGPSSVPAMDMGPSPMQRAQGKLTSKARAATATASAPAVAKTTSTTTTIEPSPMQRAQGKLKPDRRAKAAPTGAALAVGCATATTTTTTTPSPMFPAMPHGAPHAMASSPMLRGQGQPHAAASMGSIPMHWGQGQPPTAASTGPIPMHWGQPHAAAAAAAMGPIPMHWGQGQLQPQALPPQASLYIQKLQSDIERLEQELDMARVTNRSILDTYNKYREENPSRTTNSSHNAGIQKPRGTASNPNDFITNNNYYHDDVASLQNHIEKLQERCKLEHHMRLAETKKINAVVAEHQALVKALRFEIEALGGRRGLEPSDASPSIKRPRKATARAIIYREDTFSDGEGDDGECDGDGDEELQEDNENRSNKRRKKNIKTQAPKPRGKPGRKPNPPPVTVFEQAEKNNKKAIKWVRSFEVLKAYNEVHGHCNVPRAHDAKVNQWISDQRTMYRYLTQGKPSCLTPDKIRTLNSVGFQWRIGPPTRTWEENFQRLKVYSEKYGNCRVPQKKPGKGWEGLGDWVLFNRHWYLKHSKRLDADKIKRLEGIGFEWSLRNRGGTLEERMVASATGKSSYDNDDDQDSGASDDDDDNSNININSNSNININVNGNANENEIIDVTKEDGNSECATTAVATDPAVASSPVRNFATAANNVSPMQTRFR